MKVEHNGLNRLSSSEAESARPADKSSRTSGAASGASGVQGKDRAVLSDQARMLARIHSALSEVPEVRAEKVDQLREQVQTGNYSIPHEEIARRMAARLRFDLP